MDKKQIYTPPTSAEQRRLLFTVWQETGDRAEACRQAQVSESTFYSWKRRFERQGFGALDEPYYRTRPRRGQKLPTVEAKVIEIAQQHTDWGKQRIADELAASNNGKSIVSATTVKRILQDAGLWQEEARQRRKEWPKPWSTRRKLG